jgi:hypothetical protein
MLLPTVAPGGASIDLRGSTATGHKRATRPGQARPPESPQRTRASRPGCISSPDGAVPKLTIAPVAAGVAASTCADQDASRIPPAPLEHMFPWGPPRDLHQPSVTHGVNSWALGPGPLLRAARLRRRRRREHTVRSRLTGDTSTVTVRRKLVDATFKDAWLMNRSSWQPLDRVVSTIESLSRVLRCPLSPAGSPR